MLSTVHHTVANHLPFCFFLLVNKVLKQKLVKTSNDKSYNTPLSMLYPLHEWMNKNMNEWMIATTILKSLRSKILFDIFFWYFDKVICLRKEIIWEPYPAQKRLPILVQLLAYSEKCRYEQFYVSYFIGKDWILLSV